jgi:phage terminase large subunit
MRIVGLEGKVADMAVEAPKYDYVPRAAFLPLHERKSRWSVVIAHRRAGKSTALLNDLIIRGLTPRADGLRQQFAYMCPYQNQARAVVWEFAKQYTAFLNKAPGYKISEMNLTITLPDPRNLNLPGSTIMLLGAENAEKLRGIFLDGVVLDEFQDIAPYVWDTILRPALADRQGFAVFSGTTKGHDNPLWELYVKADVPGSGWYCVLLKASETGILPPEELEDLKRSMTPDAYEAEMEANPNATVTGRILLPYLVQKQITKVPWQPDGGPVLTAWDLGMSDTTSIWTAQMVGKEIHLLDSYEESGQPLSHFVDWLRRLDYARHFGPHLLPHDTNVRELGTGVSRLQTLRSLGMRNIKVVPRLPKSDQIDAARMLMARSWFDNEGCAEGLRSLRGYQFSYDKKRQCFSVTPLHDKNSNFADSYQILAVGLKKAVAHGGGTADLTFGGVDEDEGEILVTPWQPDGEIF